ncbi:4-aminobutyrate--2-oxoglutarate transaminase, partial [Streptomyces carpinensis]
VQPHGDRVPAPELAAGIARRCHAEGLLVLTAGSYGNVLRFLPPLSICDTLLEEGLTLLGEAIAKEAASAA